MPHYEESASLPANPSTQTFTVYGKDLGTRPYGSTGMFEMEATGLLGQLRPIRTVINGWKPVDEDRRHYIYQLQKRLGSDEYWIYVQRYLPPPGAGAIGTTDSDDNAQSGRGGNAHNGARGGGHRYTSYGNQHSDGGGYQQLSGSGYGYGTAYPKGLAQVPDRNLAPRVRGATSASVRSRPLPASILPALPTTASKSRSARATSVIAEAPVRRGSSLQPVTSGPTARPLRPLPIRNADSAAKPGNAPALKTNNPFLPPKDPSARPSFRLLAKLLPPIIRHLRTQP